MNLLQGSYSKTYIYLSVFERTAVLKTEKKKIENYPNTLRPAQNKDMEAILSVGVENCQYTCKCTLYVKEMCVYICPCWDQCVDEKGINVMAFFTVTHVREQAETKTELEVKGKVIKITFHHILEREHCSIMAGVEKLQLEQISLN